MVKDLKESQMKQLLICNMIQSLYSTQELFLNTEGIYLKQIIIDSNELLNILV